MNSTNHISLSMNIWAKQKPKFILTQVLLGCYTIYCICIQAIRWHPLFIFIYCKPVTNKQIQHFTADSNPFKKLSFRFLLFSFEHLIILTRVWCVNTKQIKQKKIATKRKQKTFGWNDFNWCNLTFTLIKVNCVCALWVICRQNLLNKWRYLLFNDDAMFEESFHLLFYNHLY